MPAIQIHSVPSSAIATPPISVIDSTATTAITPSNTAAPMTAKYSSLIGISSVATLVSTEAAFCIDLIALRINGAARITPMISMPMPSGRYSSRRRSPGVSMSWPASLSGNAPVTDNNGETNQ